MGIVSGNISSRAEAASPLLATEGSSHLGRDFFSFDAEISDMRDALTTALGLLVAIDLAYRIFAALSTAAKYWSGANAAAPRMEIKVGHTHSLDWILPKFPEFLCTGR